MRRPLAFFTSVIRTSAEILCTSADFGKNIRQLVILGDEDRVRANLVPLRVPSIQAIEYTAPGALQLETAAEAVIDSHVVLEKIRQNASRSCPRHCRSSAQPQKKY